MASSSENPAGAGLAGRPPEAAAIPRGRNLDRLSAPRGPKRTILLADDDPGVREMLGRVLESEHYEVILATDGNDAAAKSLARKPALALLDLNMPGRDGWSAFRFLDAAHALLPVIIITARSDQYAQAQGMHVDAIMEKPLDLPVLLDAIEQLLAESDSDRKLRLTDGNFRTARLNHGPAVPDAGPSAKLGEQRTKAGKRLM